MSPKRSSVYFLEVLGAFLVVFAAIELVVTIGTMTDSGKWLTPIGFGLYGAFVIVLATAIWLFRLSSRRNR